MITRKFEYKETVLNIKTDIDVIDSMTKEVLFQRLELERYIKKDPLFLCSLEPVDVNRGAPEIARRMAKAGKLCGVGPMAAVAGAISEFAVENAKKQGAKSAIVENGGDICCFGTGSANTEFIVGIFSGRADVSSRIGFKIRPRGILGICTSSASVGHSISFGESDAAIAVSDNASVADAAATAIGNAVKGSMQASVRKGIECAKKLPIKGAMVIRGKYIGTWGDLPEVVEI